MKYVFVGDIHGKVAMVEKALAKEGKKIFVGDFIDSFDHNIEDHKRCFDLVMDAIDTGEAEAIYGNHELSYLRETKHRCSGYNSKRAYLMEQYSKSISDRFKPYLLLQPDLLISHAGLTKQIWDKEQLSLELLPRVLEDWWPNLNSPLHNIGYARGGSDSIGGMFWCDWNHEFKPVPGLKQVFGHTRGKGIRFDEYSYCIDCLDYEEAFLELELD